MIVNVYLVNCCFMFASGWAEGGNLHICGYDPQTHQTSF